MRNFFKKVRYILEYALFCLLLRLLKALGLERSSRICGKIAGFIGPYLPVTKIAKQNIQLVMPEKQQIIQELWDNFGRFIGEFPFIGSLSQEEINKRVEIVGLENIAKFKENNKPFLLFTGHFANWDFVLRIAEKLYPKFGIVYRKANNPYIDNYVKNLRADNNLHLIAKGPGGARDLIKAIKSGYSIAMLVDQKMNEGIEVPFLGRPAMTAPAIAKLALQFNYPIVPFQIIRKEEGAYFKVIIHPPIEVKESDDSNQDIYNIMLKINHILEDWVKQNPSQWFWFHNRWKK